jgi:hypothetical protein
LWIFLSAGVCHFANNFQLFGPSYVGLLRQKGREI